MSAISTLQTLAPQVGAWGAHNFDLHAPHLGIAEEAGELVHSLLKSAQGIRGTPEEHRAKIVDAIADMMIFAAHLRFKIDVMEPVHDCAVSKKDIGSLFIAIGFLLQDPSNKGALIDVVHVVEHIAGHLKIDVREASMAVWADVRLRDWRKFPKNGIDL